MKPFAWNPAAVNTIRFDVRIFKTTRKATDMTLHFLITASKESATDVVKNEEM